MEGEVSRETLFGDIVAAGNAEFETPEWLFRALDAEFHFELDVCAMPYNAKCVRFFTPEQDGLLQPWDQNICWMNPPYGKEIELWLEKAERESLLGARVVALLPSRTNAPWWNKYVAHSAEEIRFCRGKLTFPNPYGASGVAPWGSAVALYNRFGHCGPTIIGPSLERPA
jgi:site-specific DNA-methyltransferase (adenine-specific)